MPRDQGATRPGRGLGARDDAHPHQEKDKAIGQHAMNVGWQGPKVKLRRQLTYLEPRSDCHCLARKVFRLSVQGPDIVPGGA